MAKAPVLVLGFKRPDFLGKVLSSIPQGRKVYISLDGPRTDDDEYWVRISRFEVEQFIGRYQGQVFTRFSARNLGCKNAVNSGIDWVFKKEESAIILEDDVFPTRFFFQYMDYFLKVYKGDSNIGGVNGWVPFQKNEARNTPFLTPYFQPWGWATWRERWHKCDRNLVSYSADNVEDFPLWNELDHGETAKKYWIESFEKVLNGHDTWDYQWQYSIWRNNWLLVSPPEKLVGNIGFDERSTHTVSLSGRGQDELARRSIRFPLNVINSDSPNWELIGEHGQQSFEYPSTRGSIRLLPIFVCASKFLPNTRLTRCLKNYLKRFFR